MHEKWLLGGVFSVFAVCALIEARDAAAPPTRVSPVTDVYHGVSVEDPYRWLENGANAEVRAWAAAQSARTRAYLDGLPYRSQLGARLMALTSQSSPSYGDLKASNGRLFARY